MQFITDFFTGIIVGYLSLTNALANQVIALLPEGSMTPESSIEETISEEALTNLPSQFEKKSIPDILRSSVAFQQAALSDAGAVSNYTTDPIAALVNVFCTFTTAEYIKTTTGTGFFVHSDGVILTNAHVAQFLLLGGTDLLGNAECIIRQGNPAAIAYKADLLYIPPAWVQENAAIIDAAVPTGTGERDYALLYVRESLTGEPLPARFPALKADTELLPLSVRESEVAAAGYPAGELLRNGASTPLIPRRADTTISELYTFGSNYADVFSIRGSTVGAEGSSGGPVVNEAGEAIGMIVTRGNDAVDGAGSLRAISLSHIHRTMLEETGLSFERNVSGDLPRRSQVFMDTLAPFLLTLLSAELAN
jgi:S1-C subfamily serine protease